MPFPRPTTASSPRDNGAGPPIDHTRWMAAVIELVAIVGAVVLAYLHSAQ
jgi:hypothetical protein